MRKDTAPSVMRGGISFIRHVALQDSDRGCARAEAQYCSAIAALGRLAGIDVDLGEGPEDIDARLIDAAYACNFDDPLFLGGPGCFEAAVAADAVAALTAEAGIITRGLLRYLRRRADAETLRDAQEWSAQVDATFVWLAQRAAAR